MVLAKLAAKISNRSGVELRPAELPDLNRLRALGVPDEVFEFYSKFEPAECAEIAHVRLWPIKQVLEENENYVPGCDLRPLGFIVLATNDCGDAYCIDMKELGLPLAIMSHEVAFSDLPPTQVRAEFRKVVAANFQEFLERFAAGTLDRSAIA